MINRDNYQMTRKYLSYCEDVRQNDRLTVQNKRAHLRHMLEWLDDLPLDKAPSKRPTFPRYLQDADNNRDDRAMSAVHASRVCEDARNFLRWLRAEEKGVFRDLSETWIDSLAVSRTAGKVQEHEFYPIDDVRALLALSPRSLCEQRDQAAAAFLFLSGLRVGAFTTLTLECVDLGKSPPLVKQWPDMGVKTKNRKAATTVLMPIPDLLEVVIRWDRLIRGKLPPKALWYATLDPNDHFQGTTNQDTDRRRTVADGLRVLCGRAGVQYRSVHKLRHGFTMHALQGAETVADLKAVSQNLMHSSLAITDRVYGVLGTDDVATRIAALAGKANVRPTAPSGATMDSAMMELLAELVAEKLQKGK